jgi:hypothetical protein
LLLTISKDFPALKSGQKSPGCSSLTRCIGATKKVGKWAVEKDELCLYLKEPDDGCFEVSLSGKRIEMKPSGLGLSLEGVLQTPADRN